MTSQKTDIEKTLKRILARKLTEWPEVTNYLVQCSDGFVVGNHCEHGYMTLALDFERARVTRAEWEAERALLASEQAQPLGDSEEFDQALWDKVAIACYAENVQRNSGRKGAAICAFDDADAFMAERAKHIAVRKANHD